MTINTLPSGEFIPHQQIVYVKLPGETITGTRFSYFTRFYVFVEWLFTFTYNITVLFIHMVLLYGCKPDTSQRTGGIMTVFIFVSILGRAWQSFQLMFILLSDGLLPFSYQNRL